MEIMHTDKAPAAVGPYSQAVKTGNLLFCSGQIGLNPATGEMVGTTVAEQAKQVMENVKALLENAGATFDNVVKTTCFIADMKEFGNFNEVYAQYFSNNSSPGWPASGRGSPAPGHSRGSLPWCPSHRLHRAWP